MQDSLSKAQSQTAKAVQAFKAGKIKEALRVVKDFRIGMTQQERAILSLGYECIVHPTFYKSIGKAIPDCIEAAQKLFTLKFVQ